MYKNIIFYNHFGAGDIFESREFVKEISRQIKSENYFYAHGKNPRILLDLPFLKYITVDEECQSMTAVRENKEANSLLINTWIGRDGKYVLPGIGCTVEMLYKMYEDMLGIKLRGSPIDYIPSIDYSYYDISKITNFFNTEHTYKKYIYISNGNVQSCQAENFDFTPSILELSKRHPNFLFFVTQPIDNTSDNVLDANSLVDVQGFNLNEFSYLSTFCDVLIGRNSGPHVFSWVSQNCFDKSKLNITFSYRPECAHFVYKSEIPMKLFWSPAIQTENIVETIERIFERNL